MIRLNFRNAIASLATLSCLVTAGSALATDAYPSRPVTIVVPYPPGGTADNLARVLAKGMSDRLGAGIVISNKGGAGTVIGTQSVARSDPDGYTLLWTATPLAINPTLVEDLPYDTLRDFTVVSDIAETGLVVVVNASSPIKTLDGLVNELKTSEESTYASAGAGSSPHLVSELLLHETGGKAVHVPYRGSAAAVTDLVANRTTFMFDTPLLMTPLIKDGKLRPLAQTSAERSALLPDVPTMTESGHPGLNATSWFVIAAPSGTPKDVLEKLNKAINDALADPAIIEVYAAQGMAITGGSVEKAQAKLEREMKTWALAVKVSGAKAQ